ncbi:MAG: hypothetical protein SOX26_02815 [Phocaeicola sp.]|nr:hypothetical protein [Phocaeicola sp.]
METKHLLFTMALASAFSACNNEFVVLKKTSAILRLQQARKDQLFLIQH